MSINKVILDGRLGALDERFPGVVLRVATFEEDDDGPRTEWHTVVLEGPDASRFASDLERGDRLYIEGRLRRVVQDSPDGEPLRETVIIAHLFQKHPLERETSAAHNVRGGGEGGVGGASSSP